MTNDSGIHDSGSSQPLSQVMHFQIGNTQAKIETKAGKLTLSIDGQKDRTYNIKYGGDLASSLPRDRQENIEKIINTILPFLKDQLDSRTLATMTISSHKIKTKQGEDKVVGAKVAYEVENKQDSNTPKKMIQSVRDKNVTEEFQQLIGKTSIKQTTESPALNKSLSQLQISQQKSNEKAPVSSNQTGPLNKTEEKSPTNNKNFALDPKKILNTPIKDLQPGEKIIKSLVNGETKTDPKEINKSLKTFKNHLSSEQLILGFISCRFEQEIEKIDHEVDKFVNENSTNLKEKFIDQKEFKDYKKYETKFRDVIKNKLIKESSNQIKEEAIELATKANISPNEFANALELHPQNGSKPVIENYKIFPNQWINEAVKKIGKLPALDPKKIINTPVKDLKEGEKIVKFFTGDTISTDPKIKEYISDFKEYISPEQLIQGFICCRFEQEYKNIDEKVIKYLDDNREQLGVKYYTDTHNFSDLSDYLLEERIKLKKQFINEYPEQIKEEAIQLATKLKITPEEFANALNLCPQGGDIPIIENYNIDSKAWSNEAAQRIEKPLANPLNAIHPKNILNAKVGIYSINIKSPEFIKSNKKYVDAMKTVNEAGTDGKNKISYNEKTEIYQKELRKSEKLDGSVGKSEYSRKVVNDLLGIIDEYIDGYKSEFGKKNISLNELKNNIVPTLAFLKKVRDNPNASWLNKVISNNKKDLKKNLENIIRDGEEFLRIAEPTEVNKKKLISLENGAAIIGFLLKDKNDPSIQGIDYDHSRGVILSEFRNFISPQQLINGFVAAQFEQAGKEGKVLTNFEKVKILENATQLAREAKINAKEFRQGLELSLKGDTNPLIAKYLSGLENKVNECISDFELLNSFSLQKIPENSNPIPLNKENILRGNIDNIAHDIFALNARYLLNVDPTKNIAIPEKKPHHLDNVVATEWSIKLNTVTKVLADNILQPGGRAMRAQAIEDTIDLANKLVELGDLHGAMIVRLVLAETSIDRLKSTWSFVSEEKLKSFEKLTALFSREKNFPALREKAKTSPIPFFGLFSADHLFLTDEEGNPTMKGGVINFEKMEMYKEKQRDNFNSNVNLLKEIKGIDHLVYQTNFNNIVDEFSKKDPKKLEDELFATSNLLEPRLAKGANIPSSKEIDKIERSLSIPKTERGLNRLALMLEHVEGEFKIINGRLEHPKTPQKIGSDEFVDVDRFKGALNDIFTILEETKKANQDPSSIKNSLKEIGEILYDNPKVRQLLQLPGNSELRNRFNEIFKSDDLSVPEIKEKLVVKPKSPRTFKMPKRPSYSPGFSSDFSNQEQVSRKKETMTFENIKDSIDVINNYKEKIEKFKKIKGVKNSINLNLESKLKERTYASREEKKDIKNTLNLNKISMEFYEEDMKPLEEERTRFVLEINNKDFPSVSLVEKDIYLTEQKDIQNVIGEFKNNETKFKKDLEDLKEKINSLGPKEGKDVALSLIQSMIDASQALSERLAKTTSMNALLQAFDPKEMAKVFNNFINYKNSKYINKFIEDVKNIEIYKNADIAAKNNPTHFSKSFEEIKKDKKIRKSLEENPKIKKFVYESKGDVLGTLNMVPIKRGMHYTMTFELVKKNVEKKEELKDFAVPIQGIADSLSLMTLMFNTIE